MLLNTKVVFCPYTRFWSHNNIVVNISLANLLISSNSLYLLNSVVSIPSSEISTSTSEWPNITIISIMAFLHASKLLGSSKFQIYLCSLDIHASFIYLCHILSDIHTLPIVFWYRFHSTPVIYQYEDQILYFSPIL